MDKEILKIQYQSLINLWSNETDRFWTRFQVFLAVNGGLLAVFPVIINLQPDASMTTEFTQNLLKVISIVGILQSGLWFQITRSGKEVHEHWRNMVSKFETKYEENYGKLDFKIVLSEEERNKKGTSITTLSLGLPILFFAIWVVVAIWSFTL